MLLCASVPSVLVADGSCEVTCNNSDFCLGPGSGNDSHVCLRELNDKLIAFLAKVDGLMQEANSTRGQLHAFKTEQAVCL